MHPELHHLRDQLRAILRDMADFGPTLSKPPVLESSFDMAQHDEDHSEATASHESVPGLRALRDAVKRDLEVLEKFLAVADNAYLPPLSTNATYLIAVWREVLLAPPPIIGVWQTYPDNVHPAPRKRGLHKSPGVKVDVVAENGCRWIRVNTVKNSRMLSEFRELDSYLTDSESASDSEASNSPSSGQRDSLAPAELDNSLLRMGRALLTAARQNPIPDTNPPQRPAVTLRLTRLDPSPAGLSEHDPRIAQTIEALGDMGLDVQVGEREVPSIPPCVPRRQMPSRLEPTSKVNLDLSILIALISDITHAPFPASVQEAEARFVPPPSYIAWKRQRTGASTDVDAAEGSAQHSRALAHQALQERGCGLLQEMRDRLAGVIGPGENIEFWTTPEARDRCLRIVLSKIGGPGEQRRARALFASHVEPEMSAEYAEETYWQGSRYDRGFLPLLPIRVFASDEPPEELEGPSAFSCQLAHTCRSILSRDSAPAPQSSLPSLLVDDTAGEGESIPRAATTHASPRLTAHTVRTLLWGASRGWTTMTANRASVKTILREVKVRGRAACGGVAMREETQGGSDDSTDGTEKAAIWVVDPRSLAEGMRSDIPSTDGASQM